MKKRKGSEVSFDESSRRSYLTGFGKRKQARRDKAKAEKKEKEREDVRAMKQERRREVRQQLAQVKLGHRSAELALQKLVRLHGKKPNDGDDADDAHMLGDEPAIDDKEHIDPSPNDADQDDEPPDEPAQASKAYCFDGDDDANDVLRGSCTVTTSFSLPSASPPVPPHPKQQRSDTRPKEERRRDGPSSKHTAGSGRREVVQKTKRTKGSGLGEDTGKASGERAVRPSIRAEKKVPLF